MFESWDDARMSRFDSIVPNPELIYAHGGWFEIHEAASCERDPQNSLRERAWAEYKDGELASAQSICREIMEANPYHTDALHLLAQIAVDEDHLDDAIGYGDQILDIEPNLRPYRITLMQSLAIHGSLWRFQELYGELKQKWPGEKICNPLAAEVLLALGHPEEAAKLEMLPSAKRDSLQAKIAAELSLARRAKTLETNAYELLTSDPDRVLPILKDAHDIYNKDSLISINYGLALQRAGRWFEAYDLLIDVIPAVGQDAQLPWGLQYSVVANAAVALISGHRLSEAAELLVRLSRSISDPGMRLEYWDLPSVMTWVSDLGGQIVEVGDPPKTMGPLIRKVLEEVHPVGRAALTELTALLSAYEAEPRSR
jgi:tetratricopeptide (TPR) repeat protein